LEVPFCEQRLNQARLGASMGKTLAKLEQGLEGELGKHNDKTSVKDHILTNQVTRFEPD
jgi:hypothetical protein